MKFSSFWVSGAQLPLNWLYRKGTLLRLLLFPQLVGARVRIFPTSNYTSCGEVAEFYVQYIAAGYALVVDGLESSIFAWRTSQSNRAQASHLVRSIYPDGYFVYPQIPGGDGFYVLVESEGDVTVSVESAAID